MKRAGRTGSSVREALRLSEPTTAPRSPVWCRHRSSTPPASSRVRAKLPDVRSFPRCEFLSSTPPHRTDELLSTMRSSVTTATIPPREPANRRFTVKAEEQAEKPQHEKENDHFFWTYTEEPHRTRRMAIIKAHPEVG
jgi:hypothetical protein